MIKIDPTRKFEEKDSYTSRTDAEVAKALDNGIQELFRRFDKTKDMGQAIRKMFKKL